MLVRAMRTLSRALCVQGVVALLVVLAAAFPIDEVVHDLVFRHVVSHEVRLLANGFTVLGTTAAGVAVLGTLAFVGYRTADAVVWHPSLGGLAGLAIGGLATQVVKHVACRARPRLVDGWGVGSRGLPTNPAVHGFFHRPCFSEGTYHSFPSGHATAAFTMAAALTAILPARRRAWLAVAAGVGASRVLLNAHFVSDVLGGGLIGWCAGRAGVRLAVRFAPRLTVGTAEPRSAKTRPPAGTPVA